MARMLLPLLVVGSVVLGSDALKASSAFKPTAETRACEDPRNMGLPFCNTALSIDARAEDLANRLSLEEAIPLFTNGAGNVSNATSGLWLPAYQWWSEGLHGVADSPGVNWEKGPAHNATSFPQVCLTAASFDKQLFHDVGTVVGTEGRALHNLGQAGLTYWAPNINIFRDPRWGRGQETPGEDPFLTSTYAMNFVSGMQNFTATGTPRGQDPQLLVSSCCKHFAAYDLDNWAGVQRYSFDARVSQYDLDHTFLVAMEACYHPQGGAASGMMCSYNAVNGVPSCAHKSFITDLAREQWGFNGYVTSDCGATSGVYYQHKYTVTPEQAVADVLGAGEDIDCGGFLPQFLKKAIESNATSMAAVRTALKHQFKVQMRLGMFDARADHPYYKLNQNDVNTVAHQDLALKAAREGVTLIYNAKSGGGGLPLKPEDLASGVFLLGPNANHSKMQQGDYFGNAPFVVTPLQALEEMLNPQGVRVSYMHGLNHVVSRDVSQFADACAMAQNHSVTILFLGESQTVEREGHDRTNIGFPDLQNLLMHTVAACAHAKGHKTILVSFSGGSLDYRPALANEGVKGILWAGYPGQSGGTAIAEILLGMVNPSGRLVTSQYPSEYASNVMMTDMQMSANKSAGSSGHTYRYYNDSSCPAIFKFGHGLSYSKFKVVQTGQQLVTPSAGKATKLLTALIRTSGSDSTKEKQPVPLFMASLGSVTFNVTNEGPMAGGFSALLFVRSSNPLAQEVAPVLSDFERIFLQPGHSMEVTLQAHGHSIARIQRTESQNANPGEDTTTPGVPLVTPGSYPFDIDVAGERASGEFQFI